MVRKPAYHYSETTITKMNSFTSSSHKNLEFQQQLFYGTHFQWLHLLFTCYEVII